MSMAPTVAESILDGNALLFRRNRSTKYQVRFKVGRLWYHRSTEESDRDKAITRAHEIYYEIKFRVKNDMPVVTRTFESIAKIVLKELRAKAADSAKPKNTANLYAGFIERFHIPFFGPYAITSISAELLRKHDKWRAEQVGRQVKAITVKQHNVALNLVFDKAVELKLLLRSEVPTLLVTGDETEARPSFSLEEYRTIYRSMRRWVREAPTDAQRDRRELMRAIVLVIANTGMRPMNEINSVTWGGVRSFEKNSKRYMTVYVDGKTGGRTLVARPAVAQFLQRIKRGEPKASDKVFTLPNGKTLSDADRLFKELMDYSGLRVDPDTGADRTMYSMRHFYATMALIHHRVPIHTLAKQLGTSVKMLEKHYSKLTPMMAAEQLV